jgi:hypothetical protein
VTGLWEYHDPRLPADYQTNGVLVPAWYVEQFRRALERDPADDRLREALGRFRPVAEVPRLIDLDGLHADPLPPHCDFHAELHDLTFPVPDPPPAGLVDRVLAVVRGRL